MGVSRFIRYIAAGAVSYLVMESSVSRIDLNFNRIRNFYFVRTIYRTMRTTIRFFFNIEALIIISLIEREKNKYISSYWNLVAFE